MRRERDTEGKKYEMEADGEEGSRYKMQLGRITWEWRGEMQGESEI